MDKLWYIAVWVDNDGIVRFFYLDIDCGYEYIENL